MAHLIDLLEAERDCRWRFSLIHSVRLPLHELAPSERHTQVEAAGRQQALDTRRVTAHDRVVSTTSYAPITPAELEAVLMRLAELAREDGVELRLRITGGAVMMLAFNARKLGTRDVDVLWAQPSDRLAKYAAIIASERGWPENWLNDSAKKFEQDAAIPDNEDVELRSEPGLRVTRPSLRRLLAWKLARYADDADRDDALELLRHILRLMIVTTYRPSWKVTSRLASAHEWGTILRMSGSSTNLLERLAVAALERRDMDRRALWMELSMQADVRSLERPNVHDAKVVAVAAALIELLAAQKGQEPPGWTSEVGPLPEAVYLMGRASERGYQRLRVETPRPFSSRNLYSSAKYLQLV